MIFDKLKEVQALIKNAGVNCRIGRTVADAKDLPMCTIRIEGADEVLPLASNACDVDFRFSVELVGGDNETQAPRTMAAYEKIVLAFHSANYWTGGKIERTTKQYRDSQNVTTWEFKIKEYLQKGD